MEEKRRKLQKDCVLNNEEKLVEKYGINGEDNFVLFKKRKRKWSWKAEKRKHENPKKEKEEKELEKLFLFFIYCIFSILRLNQIETYQIKYI